jgi:hypothetical protein
MCIFSLFVLSIACAAFAKSGGLGKVAPAAERLYGAAESGGD